MNHKFCKTCKEVRTTYTDAKYCEFCGGAIDDITNINSIELKEIEVTEDN